MFEASLAASRPQFSPPNRKLLPLALAAHGVLIAGVVLASYWSVSEVTEPDILVVFEDAPPPPPLGSGTRPPSPPAAPPIRRAATPPVVQPPTAEIADMPPLADVPADDAGADDDVGIALLGADGPGVPWGVAGSTGPENGGGGSAVDDGAPIIIRPGVTPPKLVHKVLPRYTEVARRLHSEGVVFLEAIIGRDGRVANVRVLEGLGFGLDEEAVAAVSQWRYEPAVFGGNATAVYLTVKVDFRLQ